MRTQSHSKHCCSNSPGLQPVKQLQHLDLNSCGLHLGSIDDEWMACLGAIGRLTQLTYLNLEYNSDFTLQHLMQLTGLSRLDCKANHAQSGYVYRIASVERDEDWDVFWAAVLSQQ
jgi:hypothetical protein